MRCGGRIVRMRLPHHAADRYPDDHALEPAARSARQRRPRHRLSGLGWLADGARCCAWTDAASSRAALETRALRDSTGSGKPAASRRRAPIRAGCRGPRRNRDGRSDLEPLANPPFVPSTARARAARNRGGTLREARRGVDGGALLPETSEDQLTSAPASSRWALLDRVIAVGGAGQKSITTSVNPRHCTPARSVVLRAHCTRLYADHARAPPRARKECTRPPTSRPDHVLDAPLVHADRDLERAASLRRGEDRAEPTPIPRNLLPNYGPAGERIWRPPSSRREPAEKRWASIKSRLGCGSRGPRRSPTSGWASLTRPKYRSRPAAEASPNAMTNASSQPVHRQGPTRESTRTHLAGRSDCPCARGTVPKRGGRRRLAGQRPYGCRRLWHVAALSRHAAQQGRKL